MLKLFWTEKGSQSLDTLEEFILEKFTQKEFDKILDKLEDVISTIRVGNVKFKYSIKTNTYKMVFHKRGTLYYQIEDDTLIIKGVWDNRMMKGKNQFE